MEEERIFEDIRYDERRDEFLLVLKGRNKFNEFLNRIHYLTDLVKHQNELIEKLKNERR